MFLQLRPLLGNHSKTNITLKKLIYTSMIRLIVTYASPAWCTATTKDFHSLNVFQNKILRKMLGAPYYLKNKAIHKDLKIDTMEEYIA